MQEGEKGKLLIQIHLAEEPFEQPFICLFG